MLCEGKSARGDALSEGAGGICASVRGRGVRGGQRGGGGCANMLNFNKVGYR